MNKAKSNYIAENINILTNLTWKELETIYYLRIPSFKDYAKNLPEMPVSALQDKSTRTSEKQPIKPDINPSTTEKQSIKPDIKPSTLDQQSKPAPLTEQKPLAARTAADTIPVKTSENIGKQTAQRLEIGIAQTIQKHLRDHVSTSPFAKLKSSVPVSKLPLSQQPSASVPKPTPIKPSLEKEQSSEEPKQELKMESAWFVEPAQPSASNSPSVQATPEKSSEKISEVSLDTAIENAFGRMLKLSKKKISEPEATAPPAVPMPPPKTPTISPLVPIPEPKLLSYSKIDTEPEAPFETASSSATAASAPLMRPAFDFSPAEDLTKEVQRQLSAQDAKVETGEHTPILPLDIKPAEDVGAGVSPPAADKAPAAENVTSQDTYVSRDVLRDLIHNHIKNAGGQGFDPGQGQSIGSGKEFEVWLNNPGRNKFIGGSKSNEQANQVKNPGSFKPRIVPADIRKSCLILGLRPETLNYETVQDAWKKSIALPGVHPDQGGDTEMAVYLNTAKDTLVRWLDAQAPKLGKKFGQPKKEP